MKLKNLALAVWGAYCRVADQPHGHFGALGGVIRPGTESGGQMPPEFPIQSMLMKPYSITANLTLTEAAHAGRTGVFDIASGATVTLPRATGSGAKYRFVCKTTVTSNNNIIQVANADDTFIGNVHNSADGGDTVVGFEVGSTSDTLTFNGSTKGGIAGDIIEIEDVAEGKFAVMVIGSATGTEATPASAAV